MTNESCDHGQWKRTGFATSTGASQIGCTGLLTREKVKGHIKTLEVSADNRLSAAKNAADNRLSAAKNAADNQLRGVIQKYAENSRHFYIV